MTTADKVRELRRVRGWSQQQLAERLGVALPTVNRWENEWREPIRSIRQSLDRLFKKSGV